MNKYQALNAFWNSFLTAYDETTVPDDAELPYITYESGFDSFGGQLALTASLWYRDFSWKDISKKLSEIEAELKEGGTQVRFDTGTLWLKKGQPFAQRMADASVDSVRRIIINLEAEYTD